MTTVKVVEGSPYGEIFTRGFIRDDGTFSADNKGKVLIQTNGLPFVTGGQTLAMGNYNPDWLGGMRNSFSYKQFDFSFMIDVRMGGDVFSMTQSVLSQRGFSENTLEGRETAGLIIPGIIQTFDATGEVVISEIADKIAKKINEIN